MSFKEYLEQGMNEAYTKSVGFKNTQDSIYNLRQSLAPTSNLCKGISKGTNKDLKAEFKEMQRYMNEIIDVWLDIESIIEMSDEE